MINKRLAGTQFLLWITLLLILNGCGIFRDGPPQQMRYYTLSYDPPGIGSHDPAPVLLQMNPLEASPPYASNRMIYADNAFNRSPYVYHEWVTSPAAMLTELLLRDFRSANVVLSIARPSSNISSPTHVISGSIKDFYEDDKGDAWEAVLSISVTLSSYNQGETEQTILMQRSYHARKSLPQNNPLGLAQAMSRAMAEVSSRLMTDVHKRLHEASPDR